MWACVVCCPSLAVPGLVGDTSLAAGLVAAYRDDGEGGVLGTAARSVATVLVVEKRRFEETQLATKVLLIFTGFVAR